MSELRIISLAPSNTEILFALNAGENVVGRTMFCDYPSEVKDIPVVGSWLNIKDLESLARLNPDVIMTCMYIPRHVEEFCEKHDVELVHVDPRTIADILESFHHIGKAIDRKDGADTLVKTLKNRLEAIKDKARELLQGDLRVYTEEFHDPPMIGGNWVPELVEIAGGTSMAESGVPSHQVTKDAVLHFNPDLIILHWCGFRSSPRMKNIFVQRGWNDIKAVKKDQVCIIDDAYLNRPGPRIWLGASFIHKLLVPLARKKDEFNLDR